MATDIRASLTNCGVSAQKARLVIDLVRGKPAVEAMSTLKFTNKIAAYHVGRLLASAVANAEQKGVNDVDKLFVKTIFVDGGAVLKRFVPRAMGRASKIRKPTSHISVVLSDTKTR